MADYNHDYIYRLTLDGNYIGKFSSRSADKGQLGSPYSVTVDPNDFIFVAEVGNYRVSSSTNIDALYTHLALRELVLVNLTNHME